MNTRILINSKFKLIGIVECMAAGLIMVAHKSGGPAMDIIFQREGLAPIGFLAADEMEYAYILKTILRMNPETRQNIRQAAR